MTDWQMIRERTEALTKLLTESNISELSVTEGDFSITLRKKLEPFCQEMASIEVIAEPPHREEVIPSPTIGVFLRRPETTENASLLCAVGDQIERGQVIGFVKEGKLLREVRAEKSGEIIEILVPEGGPVSYGDSLVRFLPKES